MKNRTRSIGVAAVALSLAAFGGTRLDLSGEGWTCEKDGVKKAVRVPATTEEFFADMSAYDAPRVDGIQHGSWIVKQWLKCKGESVWRRTFTLAERPSAPHRIVLTFEATRYFADICVNGVFVHHDEAPDMPYEVDVTDAVKVGENQLEVKITNPPGGDYDWRDYLTCDWNGERIPGGRAMGGLIGKVGLEVRDVVSFDDLSVQNTPAMRTVNVFVSVTNAAATAVRRKLRLAVEPKGVAVEKVMTFKPGLTVVKETVDAPTAKLWDLENPNLYTARAELSAKGAAVSETAAREFGYRWIAPDGIGTSNAVLRLNGKRIVIRTAIGWGWYLGHGIVPSDADAKREVAAAKALGQNAISFHRHNGQENVLREADRQGLLIYAEPGAFQGGRFSETGRRIALERVRRWVKAYRSHPSLFHWNLINEFGDTCDDATRQFFLDGLRIVHTLDPSRTVTLMSAWAKEGINVNHLPKMHLRPFDDTIHEAGWRDFHRAGGPTLSYHAGFYHNRNRNYSWTPDVEEIIYWGEEGALSAPPRLQLIVDELDRRGHDGTDGKVFRVWADRVNAYLDRKGLRELYPTLDDFCLDLGRQSLTHQGRKIELIRMTDVADGYAVNGWESMLVENNSGITDTMRNPKGDPAILAKYNAPLKLAVNSHQPQVETGKSLAVDVHIINEVDLKGARKLVVELWDLGPCEVYPSDAAKRAPRRVATTEREVTVSGGDRYGECLAENIVFDVPFAGRGEVRARLAGVEKAVGEFPFIAFDVTPPKFPKDWRIAVVEAEGRVAKWMRERKIDFAPYSENERADVIVVARPPSALPKVVGGESVAGPRDEPGQVTVRWSIGDEVKCVEARDAVALEFPQGTPPVKGVDALTGYSVEVTGTYLARWTGDYRLKIEGLSRKDEKLKFVWNGDEIRDFDREDQVPVRLKAGERVPFFITMTQNKGRRLNLMISTPEPVKEFDPMRLLAEAKRNGSRVAIISHAKEWAPFVAKATGVTYDGFFWLGSDWLGGQFFAKTDPLLDGLPPGSVGFEYEDLQPSRHRYALFLDGEQLVMGAWQTENCKLGTAIGRIPQGKGEIVISTLDILPQLGRLGCTRYLYNILSGETAK